MRVPRTPRGHGLNANSPAEFNELLQSTCKSLGFDFPQLGVMVVDHGSRRAESNEGLLRVVAEFSRASSYPLVEPAHMELAEPSIDQAFTRLVAAGAKFVVVHPYFLLPGRHWAEDIPRLAAEAAAQHEGVGHLVTAPLGIHPLMAAVMNDRIAHCLQHVAGKADSCDLCDERGKCTQGLS